MNPCGEEYGKIVWKICNYASGKGPCSDASVQLLPKLWSKLMKKKRVKKIKILFHKKFLKKFKTKFSYKIGLLYVTSYSISFYWR